MSQDDSTLRDDEWDARYFGLINDLAEKNSSRYEMQTDVLTIIIFTIILTILIILTMKYNKHLLYHTQVNKK